MYLLSDLGGTNIVAALGEKMGPLCSVPVQRPVPCALPAEKLLDALASFWRQVAGEKNIEAVLTSFPSKLENGRMVACDNLPTLSGVSLEKEFTRRMGVPVFCAPDAMCFVAGAYDSDIQPADGVVLGVTLGTGIGFSALCRGEPLGGEMAGEIWKVPYQKNNLEKILSAAGLETSYFAKTGCNYEVKEIVAAAYKGDSHAKKVVEEYAKALGTLLCYGIGILDPDCIYIGGGISRAWPLLEPVIRKMLCSHTLRPAVPICVCEDIDATPLYGVRRLYQIKQESAGC